VPKRFAFSVKFHVAQPIGKILLDAFVKMLSLPRMAIGVRLVKVWDFWLDFLFRTRKNL